MSDTDAFIREIRVCIYLFRGIIETLTRSTSNRNNASNFKGEIKTRAISLFLQLFDSFNNLKKIKIPPLSK